MAPRLGEGQISGRGMGGSETGGIDALFRLVAVEIERVNEVPKRKVMSCDERMERNGGKRVRFGWERGGGTGVDAKR